MKEIYELLNELNVDSSDIKEMDVSEIERERGKRKLMSSLKINKSNKKRIAVAVASLAIVSIVSVTIAKPTWAQNIPIIGELMKRRLIDENKQYGDYMSTVGQTKSQNGIDVTFENAVADNNMFALSFIVKNNNAEIKNPEVSFMPISLNINGKDINMSGSRECKAVDKNTVKYLCKIPWGYKELPQILNVNIGISDMFDKSGDWGVKFSMDTKDVKENTYIEKLSKKFNAHGIDFGLDEITISPLSTNVKYHAKSDDSDIQMNLLILDQDGNEVKFTGGSSDRVGCEGYEKGEIKASMNYINNGNVSSLKLIPIYNSKDYTEKKLDSKKIDLKNFAPFEFKFTDNVSIRIENLTVDGDNLIVKYNYKYAGKTIVETGSKDLGIKADGNLLKEEDGMDLFEKYKSEGSHVSIYKIGKAKDIEMEFYDGTANRLLENEAVTVLKK